mmetsp:Transcript_51405/g.115597  ORF Transcript_51405/g.115597 Transcript_51405/m.115597 type:complete len:205 (-) Transcript_51405:2-616(-)
MEGRILIQGVGYASWPARRGRIRHDADLDLVGRQELHGRHEENVFDDGREDLPAPAGTTAMVGPALDAQRVLEEPGGAPYLHAAVLVVLLRHDLALYSTVPALDPGPQVVGAIRLAPAKGLQPLGVVEDLHGELAWSILFDGQGLEQEALHGHQRLPDDLEDLPEELLEGAVLVQRIRDAALLSGVRRRVGISVDGDGELGPHQ